MSDGKLLNFSTPEIKIGFSPKRIAKDSPYVPTVDEVAISLKLIEDLLKNLHQTGFVF